MCRSASCSEAARPPARRLAGTAVPRRVPGRALRSALFAAALVAAMPLASSSVEAQPHLPETPWPAPARHAPPRDHLTGSGPSAVPPTVGGVSPWVAPGLSALVPGLGQGVLRQQRGVAYVAAEAYLILRALNAQRDARRARDAYRDIARTVARAPFGGERPPGPWSYYERLQFTLESGAFNRTPGNGFTPESDPATFNGAIWRLARETFWRDPEVAPDPASEEYRRALAFYQQRAASDDFRWSWRDAQIEQDLYRQTIDRSNEASRLARQMVGLLLANHALSLVDAYVSVRLRVFGEGAGENQRVGIGGSLAIPLPSGRGR
jgi:hypothetical protein